MNSGYSLIYTLERNDGDKSQNELSSERNVQTCGRLCWIGDYVS